MLVIEQLLAARDACYSIERGIHIHCQGGYWLAQRKQGLGVLETLFEVSGMSRDATGNRDVREILSSMGRYCQFTAAAIRVGNQASMESNWAVVQSRLNSLMEIVGGTRASQPV